MTQTHTVAKWITLSAVAVSLSGCSTLGNAIGFDGWGDNVWQNTKSTVSASQKYVARLFRPEPAARALTQTASTHIAASAPTELRGRYRMPSALGTPSYAAAPIAPQSDDLSYVKIGGGSKMADWRACEVSSDGYFRLDGTRFAVNPDFDLCMRSRGYISEAEAQTVLSNMAEFAAMEPRYRASEQSAP